jgi:hypothetical protein
MTEDAKMDLVLMNIIYNIIKSLYNSKYFHLVYLYKLDKFYIASYNDEIIMELDYNKDIKSNIKCIVKSSLNKAVIENDKKLFYESRYILKIIHDPNIRRLLITQLVTEKSYPEYC